MSQDRMTHDRVSHELPEPTVWPATLAAGVTLAAAGLVTSPLLIAVGALITLIALAGWIAIVAAPEESAR